MSDPPSATPRAKPPSNLGCVLALVALPVVIVVGLVVGTALRGGDDEPGEEHVVLQAGEAGDTAWRVDAVRDVDGQTCVFLYEDDAEDPLNGTCDLQPQDVTYGGETVVFGRADGDGTVTVQLSDDETVEVDTVTAEGLAGRFYVTTVDADVDALALTADRDEHRSKPPTP
jgi:hypothetical protein